MSSRDPAHPEPTVTLFAGMVAAAVWLPAAAVAFGPPPGAELSVEKLSRIDDFLNGEIAAGSIQSGNVFSGN